MEAGGGTGVGGPSKRPGKQASRRRCRDQDPDVRLSKALSYALRHGADKLGLHMGPDGFVDIVEVLRLPQFKAWTLDDVQRVVETNDKQRFAVRLHPSDGHPQIRANQGHSLKGTAQKDMLQQRSPEGTSVLLSVHGGQVYRQQGRLEVSELELIPLLDPADFPETVAHGTYLRHWPAIRSKGLSRMGRAHIHLAPGLPGDGAVLSGMRNNCEVAITIDVAKALADGIAFYRSANSVILTPGDASGLLPPRYFREALQLRPLRCRLPLE